MTRLASTRSASASSIFSPRKPADDPRAARHLRGRHPHRLHDTPPTKPVLLIGHRDTVFPKGEAAPRPFRIAKGRAYGPGVCDMKGRVLSTTRSCWRPQAVGGSRPRSPASSPATRRSPRRRHGPIIERVARHAACSPTWPSERRRRHGPPRRRAPEVRDLRQGRALGRQLSRRESARSAASQGRRRARADRPCEAPPSRRHHQGRSIGYPTAPHAEGQIDLRYVNADRATALAALRQIIDFRATVPGTIRP